MYINVIPGRRGWSESVRSASLNSFFVFEALVNNSYVRRLSSFVTSMSTQEKDAGSAVVGRHFSVTCLSTMELLD
ncbi:hypothetical protein [Streptomyces sp. SP18CS02]|uniref:hypothetical protein n=1 Tax=Streptomyces sp. SP18CS02 TaxID=3002531 RepID=UPI002E78B82F|nr:hypothetical protein [Streptomyces sp. SP18CS02]MEE1753164.1 hypothetical protein [Streptomyces sp. SP18CS02]